MSSVGDGPRAILPTLTPPRRSLELTGVPADSVSIPRRNPSMATPSTLSAASLRTTPPVISTLMQEALADPSLISLAAGFVDQESLPNEATAEAAAAILADPVEGKRSLQYGTTIGDVGLRAGALRMLERTERVAPGSFERLLPRVVVTQGSQQLLYLVAEVLLDPGDIVLVESPTYFVFLGVLETRGRPRHRRADRRGRPAARRARVGPRGDRGPRRARPGQADLLDHRALESDRPEPGRGSPRPARRAGEAVVEAADDPRARGRRLSRPHLRRRTPSRGASGAATRAARP